MDFSPLPLVLASPDPIRIIDVNTVRYTRPRNANHAFVDRERACNVGNEPVALESVTNTFILLALTRIPFGINMSARLITGSRLRSCGLNLHTASGSWGDISRSRSITLGDRVFCEERVRFIATLYPRNVIGSIELKAEVSVENDRSLTIVRIDAIDAGRFGKRACSGDTKGQRLVSTLNLVRQWRRIQDHTKRKVLSGRLRAQHFEIYWSCWYR